MQQEENIVLDAVREVADVVGEGLTASGSKSTGYFSMFIKAVAALVASGFLIWSYNIYAAGYVLQSTVQRHETEIPALQKQAVEIHEQLAIQNNTIAAMLTRMEERESQDTRAFNEVSKVLAQLVDVIIGNRQNQDRVNKRQGEFNANH